MLSKDVVDVSSDASALFGRFEHERLIDFRHNPEIIDWRRHFDLCRLQLAVFLSDAVYLHDAPLRPLLCRSFHTAHLRLLESLAGTRRPVSARLPPPNLD